MTDKVRRMLVKAVLRAFVAISVMESHTWAQVAPKPAAISTAKPVISAAQKQWEGLVFFNSEAECRAAYESGEFRYYVPAPKNLKPRPPVEAMGLSGVYCAREHVREWSGGTVAWVLLAEGTPATDKLDGRCWNVVEEFVRLETRRGPQGSIGLTGPAGPQGDQGLQGIPGLDGKNIVERGRSHRKRNSVASIVLGALIALVAENNWPHKKAQAKPPVVVTKPEGPVVVTKPPG